MKLFSEGPVAFFGFGADLSSLQENQKGPVHYFG